MPPRKKAAAAASTDDTDAPAPARATRSSTRTKAPVQTPDASTSAAAAPAATKSTTTPKAKAPAKKASVAKAPVKKASTAKGKKRARADEEEEEEAVKDEPAAKKAKADTTADTSGDVNKDSSNEPAADAAQDDTDDEPPKNMVTILKRGAAPVDEHSGLVASHQVYADSNEVWDCMLNQTDLGKNANKFYVIQLLHPVGNTNSCTLFTRWGRVGESGQKASKGPYPSTTAINEFKKQFKAKTATDWENRKGMITKKGKYTWLERSFEDEEEEDDKNGKKKGKQEEEEVIIPDSQLVTPLQDFVKLIFNTDYVNAALTSMNYDANKMPLGKLAKSTLLNGFAALKELAEVINNPTSSKTQSLGGLRTACQDLSGRYYSIIPHAFGRNRPTIIDSATSLKRELELIDALGDMEIAQEIVQSAVDKDAQGNPINPLDAKFRSLNLTTMDPVDRQSNEFTALDKYTQDTHGATHSHYKVNIKHAFRVERAAETAAWNQAGFNKLADGERMLLWHGSRSTNFAGILSQGLRIAPPEAPVTGYMFGKGVYFADMMSKSANYCHAYLSDNIGVLLLCEVAAKPFYECLDSEYDADQKCKSAQKLATKGIGRTQPTKWQDAGKVLNNDVLKGCTMPAGPGEDVTAENPGAYLQYNEYIVYDVSQIRVRYLLMVQMD